MRPLAIVLLCASTFMAQPRTAAADERFAFVVAGVSGSEKIAANQDKWVSALVATLKGRLALPADHIVSLTESGAGGTSSTREAVTGALTALKQRVTANDTLMVVLIGHGTAVGTVAKFNLVGPDMDSMEWKRALEGIAGRLVFVNTTSSSFRSSKTWPGRTGIVISATDSAAQRFDTMFPEYFIEALDKVSASDSDKNGRLSVWEAFVYASQAVKAAFDQKGTMVTERAVLDDNGDGVAKQATATGRRRRAGEDHLPGRRAGVHGSNPPRPRSRSSASRSRRRLKSSKAARPRWWPPITTRSWKSWPSTWPASPPRSAPLPHHGRFSPHQENFSWNFLRRISLCFSSVSSVVKVQ
jgi:hypothetical protein